MKLKLSVLIVTCVGFCTQAVAQWVSPYDNNGKVKPIGQYERESQRVSEQRNNYQRSQNQSSTSSSGRHSGSTYNSSTQSAPVTHAEFYLMNKIAGTHLFLAKRFDNNRFGIADSNQNFIGLLGENHNFTADIMAVEKNGKYGYINRTGQFVVAPDFDYGEDMINGLARVVKHGKYGFINEKGQQIIPCIYDDASWFNGDRAIVTKGLYSGIIDKTGKEIIPLNLGSITSADGITYRVKKDGKWGLMNENGKVIIPAVYDSMKELKNQYETFGNYFVVKINNLSGLINTFGEVLLEAKYDKIDLTYMPYMYVYKDGLKGLYNIETRALLPGVYQDLKLDSYGMVWTKKSNKWGLVKLRDLKEAAACQYESTSGNSPSFTQYGTASVMKDGKEGAIDTLGNVVLPFVGEAIMNVVEKAGSSTIVYRDKGLYGISDIKGNTILPPTYDEMSPFKGQTWFRARLKDKWGVIDLANKQILPLEYSQISPVFTKGYVLYLVAKNKKQGIMDTNAQLLLPCLYDTINLGGDVNDLGTYNYSAFVVGKNGKWGIASPGDPAPVCTFDSVSLRNSVFIPCMDGNCGVYSETGKQLIPLQYEYIPDYDLYHAFPVKYRGKWGYLNKSGKAITEFKYDEVDGKPDSGNYGRAKRKGKEYYIDEYGGEYKSYDDWEKRFSR